MLELNNYHIQKIENLTDLFTIIFTIVDDIYFARCSSHKVGNKACAINFLIIKK